MSQPRLDAATLDELAELILGEELGYGASRTVYASRLNNNHVIKIASSDSYYFQNIIEHLLWRDAQGTWLEKWLAPVISMSSTGRVLIMERGKPISEREMPKRVPAALIDDIKPENYVRLESGRIVRCDYGLLPSSVFPDKQTLVTPSRTEQVGSSPHGQ